ncbi:hypothetical protein DNU06_09525 [Putridiphycobacter roseus]|uniref:Uncharacterized protein n=1 Tax=Putridiphycobacter roseus TaxID=2219161 RepID=A0A2W1N204_9FLAO|nr:hypothetical protein [Putridiphycobacter roseus]PZE16981.1 hypothetical protein DNU06_09525 [Putridiphycobacter roseus]
MKSKVFILFFLIWVNNLSGQTDVFRILDKVKGFDYCTLDDKVADSICELKIDRLCYPFQHFLTPVLEETFYNIKIESILLNINDQCKLEFFTLHFGVDSVFEANLNTIYSLLGLPNATIISHSVERIDSTSYKTAINNNAGTK